MTIERISVRYVDTAEREEPIHVAAARMNSRNVGSLVVVNEQHEPVGILTDRDLAVRAVAKGCDPYQTLVADVMSKAPTTINKSASVEAALSLMRSSRCRRLPVVDDAGQLAGLVTLDDILDLLTEEFRTIGELLHEESPSSLARM